MALLIPVSWGELFDKITILEIKCARMHDPAKLKNVRNELDLLTDLVSRSETLQTGAEKDALQELIGQLAAINETLWEIEDAIRDCERHRDFGSRFLELARAVYQNNDRRAALKHRINKLLGSDLIEEKSYREY